MTAEQPLHALRATGTRLLDRRAGKADPGGAAAEALDLACGATMPADLHATGVALGAAVTMAKCSLAQGTAEASTPVLIRPLAAFSSVLAKFAPFAQAVDPGARDARALLALLGADVDERFRDQPDGSPRSGRRALSAAVHPHD